MPASVRQAAFQWLGWLNAIAWSAAVVWAAGLPLMDLKKLALADPWPRQAAGTLERVSPAPGGAPQLALLSPGNARTFYRCDLPGWWVARCLPDDAPLPAGPARIDFVAVPEGTGSPAHRLPVRVMAGDAVVYERSYADAVAATRTRCLEVAGIGVAMWLVCNLALSVAWKWTRKQRG